MNIKENKVEAMVLQWALWDSLWIPVEMKTKQEITTILLSQYIADTKVRFFLPPTLHKLYREWPYDQNSGIISSDDTYCTRATMNSLSQNKDIDFKDMMQKKIDFYQAFDFWYWGTTKVAYENFVSGKEIDQIGTPGWWNGVMMKLSPLSAYIVARWYSPEEYKPMLDTYSSMTHTHESVLIGTQVHHMFLEYLLSHDDLTWVTPLLYKMIDLAWSKETSENTIPLSPVLKKLKKLITEKRIKTISDDEILDMFWWWDNKITAYSGRIDITLWICYALFLRNHSSEWVIDAVSIGWDTDTYGAIVWNMVWAYTGENPQKNYLEKVPEINTIQDEIKSFVTFLSEIS